jgi:hypothetical protein
MMTETLEQIKQTITEAHEQGIYNWNTATISSLITTIESLQEKLDLQTEPVSEAAQFWVDACAEKDDLIESQKEEIEKLKSYRVIKNYNDMLVECNSYKAITEIAVKRLEQARDRFSNFKRNWDCDSHSDISKYNIPCRRCESIKLRELIDTTLSEIERLSLSHIKGGGT